MRNFIVAFFGVFLFSAYSSYGCTLAGKTLTDFDETEYIFIGEVIGYTSPVQALKLRENAYGLVLKVKEIVHFPKTPKTHFEIFPIQLWADCSLGGTQIEKLKNKFPINSEIRVIAKEAQILSNNLPGGNIRLEQRPDELSSIALNYDENKSRMTSSTSVFNYKSYKYDMDKDSESKYLLPNFEIRKDFLRLKKSNNQKERTDVLERLLFASVSTDLDFYSLFKNFTLTEVEFNSYYETHLKMTSPETFKQYKAYNDALYELLKIGYERDVAEKALSKALQEGIEISKQKLIERSLQILPEIKSN